LFQSVFISSALALYSLIDTAFWIEILRETT
jgi:hypothetical protein